MKLWLFGTYKWQGNPKALFLYMQKHCAETHELWWIADNEVEARKVEKMGYKATFLKSSKAHYLFSQADVYVTENFREYYPSNLNTKCIILNLWHGVGLKHIEFGLGMNSGLTKNIVKKYVTYTSLFKNQAKFLVTSKYMEQHFMKEMKLSDKQIIKGTYPRNKVYSELKTYDADKVFKKKFTDYDEVFLYAPTWRNEKIGMFKKLLPNIEKINEICKTNNQLFILKMHPLTVNDPSFIDVLSLKNELTNILFWNDDYDIYEAFDKITVGIVDYSSIFYDMLQSGIKKFIRYIPDYEEFIEESDLIADYNQYTDGIKANTFQELLSILERDIPEIVNKNSLLDTFFEYEDTHGVSDMIKEIDESSVLNETYPQLHTFDVFDTLIRRKTLEPKSIFFKVQLEMRQQKELLFPSYIVENYPAVRHQAEFDLRDIYKKTTIERDTDKIEITLWELLKRLQENYGLDDKQITFLYNAEINAELESVDPIDSKITEFFDLVEQGQDVKLVSDMYLPKKIVKQMLCKADLRFEDYDLYLSSEIGYQKSTGKLYEYVFFDCDYQYSKWVHHGDNNHADGVVPRKYGIETINHDMDTFIEFEHNLINNVPEHYKWDAYQLVTAMQRYRWKLVDESTMTFNQNLYYSFAYIGSAFVPYVDWALKHAIKQGYKTVYFISRDGYYLKEIADVLIKVNDMPIKTKYIYGSRKAWRVASFVNEVDPLSFSPFGMFSNMSSFEDMVACSQLEEDELLQIIPELEGFRTTTDFSGQTAITIRDIFSKSDKYKKRLLEIAAQKREIVREYIRQEINFDEKFAFIEFWGRGYTQDTFTRLLEDATDKEFENPFYYIRNFTPNFGKSIRHRFTSMPANFSYFESVFAQTPYKSIPGYEYDINGKVIPIIIPQENEFDVEISKGIKDFSEIYGHFINRFEPDFYRPFAEASYRYQFNQPTDEFISNVFAKFKDSLAMYGDTYEHAPIITMNEVKQVGANNLNKLTRNIPMSLARSSDNVRVFVEKETGKKYSKQKNSFIINSLDRYVAIEDFPIFAISKKTQTVFQNINWADNTKSGIRIQKNQIIKIEGYEWTKTGVPRLRIKEGFITASKDFVQLFSEINKIYSNVAQKTYKTASFEEEINFVEFNEMLEVLEYTNNKHGEFLLTPKGYIPIEQGNLSIDQLIDDSLMYPSSMPNSMPNSKTNNNVVLSEKLPDMKLIGETIVLPRGTQLLNCPENSVTAIDEIINEQKIITVDGIVQDEYGTAYFQFGNQYVIVELTEYKKIREDVQDFIYEKNADYYQLKHTLNIYNSADFNLKNLTGNKIRKYSIVSAEDIVWTNGGTPRILISDGYISANCKNIQPLDLNNVWNRIKVLILKRK